MFMSKDGKMVRADWVVERFDPNVLKEVNMMILNSNTGFAFGNAHGVERLTMLRYVVKQHQLGLA